MEELICKRIGKDLDIEWSDIMTNQEPVTLEGRKLKLEMRDPSMHKNFVKIEVSGNKINFRFRGRDQKHLGVYDLILWENYDCNDRTVLDRPRAFKLVATTGEETGNAVGDNLTLSDSIHLSGGNIVVGIKGDSAYEIAVEEGFRGTKEEWLASLRQPAVDAAESAKAVEDSIRESESLRLKEESERAEAEKLRISAEALRVKAESEREASESRRKEEELLRVSAEKKRSEAEAERASAETARVRNEESRILSERKRVEAESARETTERTRSEEEARRSGAESLRNTAENDRKEAEKLRASTEAERTEAEQGRINNESKRVSAENERFKTEQERVAAEAQRIKDFETFEQRTHDAAVNADTAAQTANAASESLNTKVTEQDKKIEGKVDKVEGLGLSEENYTAKEKEKLAGIEENSVARPKGGYNRNLYEGAGARYNEDSGFYELNGLTDITEEEMAEIYNLSKLDLRDNCNLAFLECHCRTNIMNNTDGGYNGGVSFLFAFRWAKCININLANNMSIGYGFVRFNNILGTFGSCRNLEKILTIIDVEYCKTVGNPFTDCPRLKEVRIKLLHNDIQICDSPLLSKDSVLYMIKESAVTSAFTITLHPMTYKMAIADADIQSALKDKPLVSLASV